MQSSEKCWDWNQSAWCLLRLSGHELKDNADWVKRCITMEVDGNRQEVLETSGQGKKQQLKQCVCVLTIDW